MSLDQQFKEAVSYPLDTLTVEDLKPIALAIWYEDYTPNLNDLGLKESRKAGYVVDSLMRFSCVSNDRKRELLQIVQDINELTAEIMQSTEASLSEEPLAAKWHLCDDIAQLLQELLPYQTRHYVHS